DRMAADGVDRRWPELAFWLPKAELYVANRERTKATAVLLFNELRLDLFELGRRLAAEGDLGHATDVGRLTIDEVGVAAATGSVRSGVVEARAAHMAELRGLVPPLVVEAGAVPPLGDWRRAGAGAPMQARVRPGVARAPGPALGR